jgi:hypothetical protein
MQEFVALGGDMRAKIWIALAVLTLSAFCAAQTIVEVQEVKELKPGKGLGTCSYVPTPKDSTFFKKLAPAKMVTGSIMDAHEDTLHGKKGHFVSWYGVVHGASQEKDGDNSYKLLLEQKYFDGMTDCHIMLASHAGAGDFVATMKPENATIPALSLVRVYGTVTEETAGIPSVTAEYIRV